MTPRSGEELNELEARQEPRLVKALEMVAPGTAVREGIDNIVHARTGGLIVIGDPDELAFLFSGGIKLDITTDDVGLSGFHDFQSLVTPELQAAIDTATAGLKDGSIQACELTPFASCVVPTN